MCGMRVWRNRIQSIVLTGIITLFSANWSTAGGAAFELIVVNTGQTISCDKLRLDPGSFRCKRGEVTYKYDAAAIESVMFDGQSIYPYDTVELTESDLYEKDCEYLINTMKGPLILENDPDIFILVGTMYEKGICTRQNVQQAYTYYRRAGKLGMQKYNDLRRRSG